MFGVFVLNLSLALDKYSFQILRISYSLLIISPLSFWRKCPVFAWYSTLLLQLLEIFFLSHFFDIIGSCYFGFIASQTSCLFLLQIVTSGHLWLFCNFWLLLHTGRSPTQKQQVKSKHWRLVRNLLILVLYYIILIQTVLLSSISLGRLTYWLVALFMLPLPPCC